MLLYRIMYVVVYVVSLLPMRVMYLISDAFYYLTYYVIKYRREIIYANIRRAFPEKSEAEVDKIAKGFYRIFCDWLFEIIKGTSISKKELLKRCVYLNMDMLIDYAKQNKKIMIVTSHYGNWEFSNYGINYNQPYKSFTAYKPLSNKSFDKLMHKIRNRYGVMLLPTKQVVRQIIKYKNEPTFTYLIWDQSPSVSDITHYFDFFHSKLPFFTGPEQISKMMDDFVVVYARIRRPKRGYYETEYVTISESPKNEPEFEITAKCVKELENMIKERPEIWLWSHRRWKHEKK